MKKFCLSLFFALSVLCANSSFAQTLINPASITSYPYVIYTPGSYKLTGNINVTSTTALGAIYIGANNVTLDLNGYSITGPMVCTASGCSGGSSTYGVQSVSNNSVVINGNISGFFYGVLLNGPGRVENINASSCSNCIDALQQGILRHNIVYNCGGWGIAVGNGVATENTVYSCSYGMYARGSSAITNSISNNTNYGLYAWNSVYENNVIMSNGTDISLGPDVVSLKSSVCTTLGPC